MDKTSAEQVKETNIIELEFLELTIDNNKFIISNQIINKEKQKEKDLVRDTLNEARKLLNNTILKARQ